MTAATGIERIWWIILILLVVSYLAGTWLNRQRSKAIGAWLQAGLGSLGGRLAWRWIRGGVNSGAEVTVSEARAPYRQLRIGYFLLTREFPPLWAIERLRKKGDLLSLHADLRNPPVREFEVLPLQGALRRKLDEAAGTPWHWQPLAAGLGLATRTPADQATLDRVTSFVARYGAHTDRISLRQRAPHLVAFIRLPGKEPSRSAELWAALGDLAKR